MDNTPQPKPVDFAHPVRPDRVLEPCCSKCAGILAIRSYTPDGRYGYSLHSHTCDCPDRWLIHDWRMGDVDCVTVYARLEPQHFPILEERIRQRAGAGDWLEQVIAAIDDVYWRYWDVSMMQMTEWLHNGQVTQVEYEAFGWLWQNSAVRLGAENDWRDLGLTVREVGSADA